MKIWIYCGFSKIGLKNVLKLFHILLLYHVVKAWIQFSLFHVLLPYPVLIKCTKDYKSTKSQSLRKQDWKNIQVETEKVNILLLIIPTGNINELNKLIYAGMKLVCEKIGVPLGNSNRNTKAGWEIRLEGQVKKFWQVRVLRKEKNATTCRDEKIKTKQQKNLTLQLGIV